MRLRFLGSGTSYGVPYVGCDCAVCTSDDARDKRLRASHHRSSKTTPGSSLIPAPIFAQQCLRAGVIDHLDAILWTHLHNDHIIGLDDIRPLTDKQGYIPGYANGETMERLQNDFRLRLRSRPRSSRISARHAARYRAV